MIYNVNESVTCLKKKLKQEIIETDTQCIAIEFILYVVRLPVSNGKQRQKNQLRAYQKNHVRHILALSSSPLTMRRQITIERMH